MKHSKLYSFSSLFLILIVLSFYSFNNLKNETTVKNDVVSCSQNSYFFSCSLSNCQSSNCSDVAGMAKCKCSSNSSVTIRASKLQTSRLNAFSSFIASNCSGNTSNLRQTIRNMQSAQRSGNARQYNSSVAAYKNALMKLSSSNRSIIKGWFDSKSDFNGHMDFIAF